MDSVRTKEQPTGEPLLHFVLCVASRRLHCLHELSLNVPERECLKGSAKAEFSLRGHERTGIAMPRDLRIDAIETSVRSHKGRDANDRLVAEHPDLDLRSILEGCGHGCHSLFNEEDVFDQLSRKFDLM